MRYKAQKLTVYKSVYNSQNEWCHDSNNYDHPTLRKTRQYWMLAIQNIVVMWNWSKCKTFVKKYVKLHEGETNHVLSGEKLCRL